jgi:hypothetical protein
VAGSQQVACHYAEELVEPARRSQLIASAAASSSALEAPPEDDDGAGPTWPTDDKGLLDIDDARTDAGARL